VFGIFFALGIDQIALHSTGSSSPENGNEKDKKVDNFSSTSSSSSSQQKHSTRNTSFDKMGSDDSTSSVELRSSAKKQAASAASSSGVMSVESLELSMEERGGGEEGSHLHLHVQHNCDDIGEYERLLIGEGVFTFIIGVVGWVGVETV
jgi:hypothetical protein